MDQEYNENDIAIVGMACRFPGVNSPAEYWDLLAEGRESLTSLDDEALLAAGVPKDILRDKNYVKAGMFLQNMEQFDAGFFGFSPLDAKILDPQHRHFLECGWEACEDAGYDPAKFNGSVGVFAGSGHNAYMPYNLLSNPDLLNDVGFFLVRHTGNDKDFLTTRLSYLLNLTGPSVNVQTACSTSLVAVHMASQSLLNGECDMALAGGVTIELPHRQGYLFKESEILSPDGHCRPFEASSKGTVFGSGAGVVVLRRLQDAVEDGDNIHAVIKSSAINNDGSGKVSYLAPSVDGQAAAINEALEIAEVDPQSVTYIECHGTGTQLGDPIEVAALSQAYGAENERKEYCALGSVKSNIGHLDTAAGVASLIKVVQSLKHRKIPGTLHFRQPNPSIDFANSPFFVNDQLRDWQGDKLRAGVSSLGVGGTNAHLILEEFDRPRQQPDEVADGWTLLPLSARTDKALLKGCDRLARFLEETRPSLSDTSFTLSVGRRGFTKRRFALVQGLDDAIEVLDGGIPERIFDREAPADERDIAFMFAGGGAQYPNMGRELYDKEPVFSAAVDECLQILTQFIDFDLKSLLYPSADAEEQAATELQRPSRTLPALFVTQYAQAQLWMSKGVVPAAMIGHSMGENTAACLAGVLSLKDALGLVSLRGRLFETVAPGGMLSVQLSEQELKPFLGNDLDIAGANAPGLTVVSGPTPVLEQLERKLGDADVMCQRVRINIAAHSRMLEPILQAFGDYLRSVNLGEPKIPFISNRSGGWITDAQATDPEYWVAHLRNTVRFADGVGELLKDGKYALLEVGPGNTLASLATMHESMSSDKLVQSSLRHPSDDVADIPFMLTACGQLWAAGAAIDWQRYFADGDCRRISLPSYAFDHARHWVEPGKSVFSGGVASTGLERSSGIDDFMYQPSWQARQPSSAVLPADASVLFFSDGTAHCQALQDELSGRVAKVITVRAAKQYSVAAGDITLRPGHGDDYVHMVGDLLKQGAFPGYILHAWPLAVNGISLDDAAQQQALAFDSLLFLAQAIGNEDIDSPIHWLTLTHGAQRIAGEPLRAPLAALVQGPMRVIPAEMPTIRCASIDIDNSVASTSMVLSCLAAAQSGLSLAQRGDVLYRQVHSPVSERDTVADAAPVVREGACYLITGGTGGLGLVAARMLAQQAPVKLALMSRQPLPEREFWPALIADAAPESAVLQSIEALEALGSEVLLVNADVSARDSMQQAAAQIKERWGAINGIIHTAGVINDGLLQLKDLDEANAVLAPKVTGSLVLDEVFGREPLDFVVLYSSTSAFFGLPGQIDYAAANAFLDSWALARTGNGISIAVNWPAWKEAGMAASIAAGSTPRQAAGRPVNHPLLDRCIEEQAATVVYSTLFSVAEYWLLDEHRLKDGPALIPGSGFIELARAAYQESSGEHAVEISDAAFQLPFIVADHETRELQVALHSGDGDTRFVISSESEGELTEHVSGTIGPCQWVGDSLPVDEISARCQQGEQLFTDPDHHPHLDFGPRWGSLEKVAIGQSEALISLSMAPEYQPELADFRLHPAVLDMATAGAQVIIEGHDPQAEVYVPVGYGDLRFSGALSAQMVSHVSFQQAEDGKHGRDIAQFNVRVADASGQVLLEVDNFTMQRLSDTRTLARGVPVATELDPALKRTLELGIDSEEGSAVLASLLQNCPGPQVAISAYALGVLEQELTSREGGGDTTEVLVEHDADADADIPEIEQGLGACEAIDSVVVRSHLDDDGGRRLVAHYVVDWDHSITVSELRKFARENLAAELVPQYYVEHDDFPVDGNNQVDRSSLADPLAPEDNFVAPRTSVEKTLARVWQEVLGADRVGLNDNFFDIGGHSLLSIRVIVRVDKKLGVRLDQATMVLHTLEQIAREIEEKMPAEEGGGASEAASASGDGREEQKSAGFIKSIFGRK